MQLSIDTSTRYASLALADAGNVIAELSWYSNQNHTVELVPNIQLLLHRYGVEYQELSLLGVAVGPGNFSAVRVALSVAKGLSIALGIPIAPVSTLLVEAYPYLATGRKVSAMVGAGRGQVVAASYQKRNGEKILNSPVRLVTIQELLESAEPQEFLCGEGMNVMTAEELLFASEMFIITSPQMRPSRRASSIIHLLSDGDISTVEDVAIIEPIYARPATLTQPRTL
jgi:tRNA threonylcarbamoyladenosine biosynthesis protein TsaB